jgi:hypothetical protein
MFHRRLHPRGSALTLAIIVSIVLTGLIVTLAWVASAQTQYTSGLSKVDQAFFSAEAGAQRVQWYCKHYKLGSITSPLNGSVNGYSYSATWSNVVGSTILIRSTGASGRVSYALSQRVRPPYPAPALATGGNFDNKNIDILGDIVVGSYTNSAGGVLNGNLTYSLNATNTAAITGAIIHDGSVFLPIDMTALGNTLIAAAGQSYSGDLTNPVFDFTLIPGTNKVIYVSGNVTNPTFIGAGTLYCAGTLSVNNVGTAANPVNLVAKGDISLGSNVFLYGGVYTGGTLVRGKFAITGIVYAAVGISDYNNPTSYFTYAAPPWFDPRMSSWDPITSFTNFTGPMP